VFSANMLRRSAAKWDHMVDGANICSHEGQTILWMKADVEEVILIHFTEIDNVVNSELWDSDLEV
jgi:hypothetical protein